MAIDTKTKRLSMLNFGTLATDTLPEPDALIDEGDRLHLLNLFSGNAAPPGGPSTPARTGIGLGLIVRNRVN